MDLLCIILSCTSCFALCCYCYRSLKIFFSLFTMHCPDIYILIKSVSLHSDSVIFVNFCFIKLGLFWWKFCILINYLFILVSWSLMFTFGVSCNVYVWIRSLVILLRYYLFIYIDKLKRQNIILPVIFIPYVVIWNYLRQIVLVRIVIFFIIMDNFYTSIIMILPLTKNFSLFF